MMKEKGLTERQREQIRMNLRAFMNVFGGDVRIVQDSGRKGAFFVYYPADAKEYIQYCKSIDYLDGWLYGCVQAKVRGEFHTKKDEYEEE